MKVRIIKVFFSLVSYGFGVRPAAVALRVNCIEISPLPVLCVPRNTIFQHNTLSCSTQVACVGSQGKVDEQAFGVNRKPYSQSVPGEVYRGVVTAVIWCKFFKKRVVMR